MLCLQYSNVFLILPEVLDRVIKFLFLSHEPRGHKIRLTENFAYIFQNNHEHNEDYMQQMGEKRGVERES